MKKVSLILLAAVFVLLTCSCSPLEEEKFGVRENVMQDSSTWYEDGAFFEAKNSDGEGVLCCYSKKDNESSVMCSLPDCTHKSETSKDCEALADDNTLYRYGINRIEEKLYYIAVKMSDEKSAGSIDLIECDIDGKNRRVAASVENTYLPFITGVQYTEDHVLIAYYQNSDLVKNESTGLYDFVYLDKYRFYIKQIEISTGNVETLLFREEYDGCGNGTVYDNTLYYNYSYHNEAPTGEALTPETAPPWQGGFYIRDLSTGEEKEYEGMFALGISLGHFSPERIIVSDREKNKLCRFDIETDKFTEIADYDLGSYTEDEKEALFLPKPSDESEFLMRYSFESGELSKIPYSSDSGFSPNLTHTVGNTAWIDKYGSNGKRIFGYMDRDDFFEGKFDNINVIEEVKLQ